MMTTFSALKSSKCTSTIPARAPKYHFSYLTSLNKREVLRSKRYLCWTFCVLIDFFALPYKILKSTKINRKTRSKFNQFRVGPGERVTPSTQGYASQGRLQPLSPVSRVLWLPHDSSVAPPCLATVVALTPPPCRTASHPCSNRPPLILSEMPTMDPLSHPTT
jgi:hypothetical protein